MSYRSLKISALVASLILAGCATRLPMPEYCSPSSDKVVCESKSVPFPDANRFLCFDPEQIEPFLERCGKR